MDYISNKCGMILCIIGYISNKNIKDARYQLQLTLLSRAVEQKLPQYDQRHGKMILQNEFVAVSYDDAYSELIKTDKDILEFDKCSKNISDAESDDENEMNNAVPVPTSSEMWNIIKSMRGYLDAHYNGEMNNKMDDMELFDANKTIQRRILEYFPKTL
ncbi:hypothetical protein TNCV_2228271 [Trichonephila clavipes]|nr:hypothetical protein TNCV_2228271 [Trichonephila clavipes]